MSISRAEGLMVLASLPGLGPVNIRKLDRALGGSVEGLLEMEAGERGQWCSARVVGELADWRAYFDPERVSDELERLDGDYVTSEEADYPELLQPYADRPVGLYRSRCGVADLGGRVLAIVGTRQPSQYGRKVARTFSGELAQAGYTIVSGMAEGIDTEAHRAALMAGGRTAAVLGGGLNRCYPASNRGLMKEITESAGVWTEFPLWRKPDRRSFPQRNRIVSGVSEAVLVIESGLRGGSLITARLASEQGKPVYVIPGRIDAPESAGCHALIRDGAQLVSGPEEILEDLSCLPGLLTAAGVAGRRERERKNEAPARIEAEFGGTQAAVWRAIGEQGRAHVDGIARALSLPVPEISRAVMEMELGGHLVRRLDGCYERS